MSANSKIEDLKRMITQSSQEWTDARSGDESPYLSPWARRDKDVLDDALLLIVAAMGEEEPLHAVGGIVEDQEESEFEVFVLATTCAVYARFDSGGIEKVALTRRSALIKLDALRAGYSNNGRQPLIREYYAEYREGPKVYFPLRNNTPTQQTTELFHELRDDLGFVPN